MGFKGLGREAPTPLEDVKVLRLYLEQLASMPYLDGQEVTGVMPIGGSLVDVRHSLGRAYRGCWLVGQQYTPDAIYPLLPENARSGGTDITNFVTVVSPSAVVGDTSFKLWVY
jgi:hypothetical protein